jgi:hypothetical protein
MKQVEMTRKILSAIALSGMLAACSEPELTWSEPFYVPGTEHVLKPFLEIAPGALGQVLCWSHGAPHSEHSVRGRYGYHWVDLRDVNALCVKS